MFRFDLTQAEITHFTEDKMYAYIFYRNNVKIILLGYLYWDIIEPKNLPFWTKWKLKRSILWEVKRREKEKRRQAKIDLIKKLGI